MYKTIFALLLALSALGAQAQEALNQKEKTLEPCVFEGTLAGVPEGSVVMIWVSEGSSRMGASTDTLANGKFRIVESPKTPIQEFFLSIDGHSCTYPIYAEPGTKTIVTGNGLNGMKWKVENDFYLQKESNNYLEHEKSTIPEWIDLQSQYSEIGALLHATRSESEINELKGKRAALSAKMESLTSAYVENMLDYIKDRERNIVWLKELLSLMNYAKKADNVVYMEKIRKLYESIPHEYKETLEALKIKTEIYPTNAVKIGDPMADFVLYDLDGKQHHLNEFKGKYTILEFSGLGCGACYAMRPHLEEVTKKYANKLELVTVSYDSKNIWHTQPFGKVSWHEWNDYKNAVEIMAKYAVDCFPTFIFISPEQNIIGRADSRDFDEVFSKCIK